MRTGRWASSRKLPRAIVNAVPSGDRRVVTDDGVSLWMDISGSGFPLVLCHGGPGLWDSLGRLTVLIEHLATVYRWDQRGCGRSDRVGPYTVERTVRDMEVIREQVGAERWVVGGHSWGATLALHYAAAHPGRAAGLIYISGTGLADSWAAGNRAAYRAERRRRLAPEQSRRLKELSEVAERTPAQEHEFRLLSWMTDVSPDLDAEELLSEDLDAPWAINFEANRALGADAARLAPELRHALAGLDLPALIVHGANDPRPLRGAAELAGLLPRSRLVTLPTGHGPWLEAPSELGDVLAEFVTSTAPL
jgi:proline iminopeptidase